MGTLLATSPLLEDVVIKGVDLFREGKRLEEPGETLLQAGDHLKVRCDLENFRKLKERRGIALRQGTGAQLSEEAQLIEAVIAPLHPGWSQPETGRFRSRYGLQALAIRHRNRVMREHLEEMPLKAGDVLLFEVEQHHLEQLRDDKPLCWSPRLHCRSSARAGC